MMEQGAGVCVLCNNGKEVPVINGLCHWHNRRQQSAQRRVIQRKYYIRRSIPTPPDPEMNAWYGERVKGMNGRCMECDALISVWNYTYAKAAIAHILPVEFFPSIKTHPFNFLELDAHCGCHDKWDRHWDSASSMRVFPVAVERFLLFFPAISPAEHLRIPDIFTKYLLK